MKLVLAEKPSVAMSLSKVIGADQRGDGYMEGNGYLVSWCVGHLVELSQPEAYDEKYAKWKYDDLPILPEHWQYQVSASTKKQFGILKKLMQRKDVESLICATDAGREGELIFRLVYHQCGCKKPVERLWISSMEDSAIREGFQKLRPGTEYDALYEAALCRERADWIVGINATRLFSCLYGQTLNVGRVMTPTLAMVVMRDAAIRAFKPEPFYSAELKFRDFQAGGERIKAKADAEKLVAECCQAGNAIITKVEQKEKSEKPPALFDLTSLQREANRQLGFTAQQTLDYTQALYEKKLRKGKTGRCNKVLYRQPALRQPLPIEIESVMVTHVEHIVHQMKPFLAVQQFCPDTQAFEVVHQVDLDVNEPRLCLFHGFRLNAKRQVLRLGQAVVALGKLAAQHGAVLRAHRIEMILLVRDTHHLLKIRGIRSHIHKRKLKADAGIKEVQEAAPFLKDSRLILLLCQLVIDVLKLNGFGVVVVRHTADTIREHPLKGNAILS